MGEKVREKSAETSISLESRRHCRPTAQGRARRSSPPIDRSPQSRPTSPFRGEWSLSL
jgi:hypothetical protein